MCTHDSNTRVSHLVYFGCHSKKQYWAISKIIKFDILSKANYE